MDRPHSSSLIAALFLCGIGLGFLPSCRNLQGDVVVPTDRVTIPPSRELEPPKVTFYTTMSEDAVLYELTTFLARRGLISHYMREDDAFRIATRPTEEISDEKHFRHITYAIKVALFGPRPECTWVEIRWDLEARPYYGTDWRVIDDPPEFKPLLLKGLSVVFEGKDCPLK